MGLDEAQHPAAAKNSSLSPAYVIAPNYFRRRALLVNEKVRLTIEHECPLATLVHRDP